MNITKDQVVEALERVLYLPKGDNIINLNMVNEIIIKDHRLFLTMLFEENNPKTEDIVKKQCVKVIKDNFPKVHFETNHIKIIRDNQHKNLADIKHIIGVASGKGGVGKSMVSVNLAATMAKIGYKVGLLDADIHGPSIPIMLGLEDEKPETYEKDGKGVIYPIVMKGMKVISVGFFVDPKQALIWRGPMASNALKQLMLEAKWGELDYLIVDLPPGTSDIHLTLTQDIPLHGVVIVSTPQKIALADAIKAFGMFQSEKIQIPILGLVENMSYFTPEELPDNKYYIFGKEGGRKLAEERKVPYLGGIPIVQSIREAADKGKLIVFDDNKIVNDAFDALAKNLIEKVDK